MSRVLVVDDEQPIVRALSTNLRARGYDVDLAVTGEEGLRAAAVRHPDAVILDLGLPGIDGIDVVRALRGWSTVPIIILSARGAEDDKITALDAGADDYLAKPFGMGELLARLRAVLRRGSPGENDAAVVTGHFEVDLAQKRVTASDGSAVHLTPTEWKVLEALVRFPGRLVTPRDLLHQVWGPGYGDETNALRVHLTHLRSKLEPDTAHPRYLITEPGMGYRFNP